MKKVHDNVHKRYSDKTMLTKCKLNVSFCQWNYWSLHVRRSNCSDEFTVLSSCTKSKNITALGYINCHERLKLHIIYTSRLSHRTLRNKRPTIKLAFLSVRLSVVCCLRRARAVSKQTTYCVICLHQLMDRLWKENSSKVVATVFLPRGCYVDGDKKQSRFSTNISLYLRNDTECSQSYNGILIGTYIRPTKRCKFKWSWVTAKFSTTRNIARRLCDR